MLQLQKKPTGSLQETQHSNTCATRATFPFKRSREGMDYKQMVACVVQARRGSASKVLARSSSATCDGNCIVWEKAKDISTIQKKGFGG